MAKPQIIQNIESLQSSVQSHTTQLADMSTKTASKKGVNFYVSASTVIADAKTTIDTCQADGANMISFIVNLTQALYTDNNVTSASSGLFSNLSTLITYCNTKGLEVHYRMSAIALDGKGLSIQPSNESLWLTNWKTHVLSHCSVIYPLGVRTISVSNEQLYMMDGNSTEWTSLISEVHSTYPGMLVAVNTNIFTHPACTVYDLFDIIGFNFYPCLTKKGLAETDLNLRKAFYDDLDGANMIETLLGLSVYGKPVWVTEIGCLSYTDTLRKPYAPKSALISPVYSEETQKKFYELFFELIYKHMNSLEAIILFTSNDADFGFIGKQAETVVQKYWR